MLDVILMIWFAGKFRRACFEKGQAVRLRNFKMIVFWLLAELLVMYSCMSFGLQATPSALIAMGAGVFVGYLTFRQNIEGLSKDTPKQDDGLGQ